MTLTMQELDLAKQVETEVLDYAASNTYVTAEQVVEAFKNVAIDLQKTVAQLPVNLWQIFHYFEQRPPSAVMGIEEVIRRLKSA